MFFNKIGQQKIIKKKTKKNSPLSKKYMVVPLSYNHGYSGSSMFLKWKGYNRLLEKYKEYLTWQ